MNPEEYTRLMPLAVQGVLYYPQVASVYAIPASYLFAANDAHRPWHQRRKQGQQKIPMSSAYATSHKVLNRDELAVEVQRRQAAGERGVLTNGCFDLLHLGHVRYLQQARALGDFLILGLNNDGGVRLLKGPGRPLVPEHERAEILATLTCVDYVTIFSEPTAGPLVELLQPAIYVKGGDYASDQAGVPDANRLPEAKVVQAYGGVVRLIPYLPHHSTTELIESIKHLP